MKLPPWVWVFAFLVCLPSILLADTYSFKVQDDVVRLYDEPCEVKSSWFKDWRKANFFYHGKNYASCWRTVGQTVLVLDSEGEITPIPLHAFRKDVGI